MGNPKPTVSRVMVRPAPPAPTQPNSQPNTSVAAKDHTKHLISIYYFNLYYHIMITK